MIELVNGRKPWKISQACGLLAAGLVIGTLTVSVPAFAQTAPKVAGAAPEQDTGALRSQAKPEAERSFWLIPTLHGLGVMAGMRVGEVLLLGGDFELERAAGTRC